MLEDGIEVGEDLVGVDLVEEVGELVAEEGVVVVGQRDQVVLHFNQISDCGSVNFLGEEGLPFRIEGLAVGAVEVHEDVEARSGCGG